jgi:hypothetical protein
MLNLRAPVVPRPTPRARSLGWILVLVGACSVYDPSLLSQDRSTGSDTGGSRATGGGSSAASGSGGSEEGGANTSGGSAGAPEESGGTTSSGGTSLQGGSGGSETAGSDTGGNATGGDRTTGGTNKGGAASGGTTSGGASSTGGNTGGASKGGTASTGGNAGAAATGGATKGGSTSTGGAGGTAGGGSGGNGGSSGSDACPNDPNKTAPGVCGCGIPEQDSGTSAGCLGLRAALVHRYNFSGTGNTVTDSIGTAHGTAVNTTVSGGTVVLASTTPDQYVDLPNGILSSLVDATLEIWVTWGGGANWQRLFDLGSSSGGEGVRQNGVSFLFFTPKGTTGNWRAAFSLNGTSAETGIDGSAALPSGVKTHCNVVVDDTSDQLLVYVNGTLAGSKAFAGRLSAIADVNNWLGRSQFAADPGFAGTLHEFRIYNAALSAAQIQLTEQTGESPSFF